MFTTLKSIFSPLILLALLSQSAFAEDDPVDKVTFDEGTVLIHCSVPKGEEKMSTKMFEEATPKMFENLGKHAKEGRVLRVHFLSNMKQGIAIVVAGKDKKEAMSNAGMIFVEQDKILREVVEKQNSEHPFEEKGECVFLEIGPVALLP